MSVMSQATPTSSSSRPASPTAAIRARRPPDPRYWQIAVLGSLLLYGIFGLDFEVTPARTWVIVLVAMSTQWLGSWLVKLPRFDPWSALVTCLSLSLLLRTGSLWVAALAAAIAIGSKFVIRVRGKHVFNPANFALVAAMLLTDDAWVSPGQWGSAAWLALLVAGLGLLVTYRAERSDVTWAFLAAWSAVCFGRAAWLGDPWAIPIHQLQNGAFLIFAFYMISDPKTTPDRRIARVAYAVVVALVAGYLQFYLFRPTGMIWAPAFCSPLVPLIDRWLPAPRYAWRGTPRADRGRGVHDFAPA
jgi:enediyne biosynthesis protein E5